ncbi:MAG: hypothetical protein DRR08_20620 [Candidatus Parabeggiatoa sp. nov. 2]|nr:MAG: hypothetical protein B6247_30775 [Beggiatoa sp. 4572_84]RKZ56845.1 MAG: hypothetical protein DRR08_20620 [Gammaproteobacteria bacterium]
MDQTYYKTVTELEKMSVDRDYLVGWMGGYLQNPQREEQRVTSAYEAGYADGSKGSTDMKGQWTKK